jgi:Leucine-rich repeat (LRR) protein
LFLDGPIYLSKLSGLRSLLIYHNIDTDVLCDDIASLTKLTQLLLTKVDGRLLETLANFSNIATLRLGFLASFANWNNLAMLTNVQALSMTENRLDLYFPALCQLSQLTSLSVSPALASKYSELTRISRLDRLERLLLEVQDVPAEVGQLTQLTQLETFFDGDTTKLVTKFQRLKVIKCLRVEGDLLRQLPKLPNLEKIVVPGIEMNSHFEELIACSKLTCLKIGCSDRLNIMTPEVASNLQLQMYERVAKLTTLKELEIDYYDNIEPLLVLTNLQSLRVYANYRRTPVEELAAIKRLPNLAKFFFDTIDTVLSAREIKQKLFSADSHVQVSVPRVYV